MRELVELFGRVAELERRFASTVRHGTVHEVNPEGQVRLRLGGTDDQPFVGPWVPYGQLAGALKVHTPPTVGQQMTQIAPGGDFRQAVAIPMTWSEANAAPSAAGDENVVTFGEATIRLRGDELSIKLGDTEMTVSTSRVQFFVGDFAVALTSDGLAVVGGKIQHNGIRIDDQHRHKDTQPSAGLFSGIPDPSLA